MRAFAAITGVSVKQLTDRRRMIGFALLSLVPAAFLLMAARGRAPEGVDSDLGLLLVTPLFSVVLPLITLVLAGSALGDERNEKTLSFLTLRPVARTSITGAKSLAASAVAAALAALGALALVGVYMGMGGSAAVLPAILVGTTIACLIYGAGFTLLGLVVSRPTLVGLVWVLLLENTIATNVPGMAAASPWRIGLAATLDLLPTGYPARELYGAIGYLDPSFAGAALRMVVIVGLSVGVGALVLRRTDAV